MSALVVDCSVVAAWILPDESNSEVEAVRMIVAAEGGLVPGHWRLEIANMLLMAERRKRLPASERAAAFDALERLEIEVDPETGARAWREISALAARFRLTAYDAAYLELAQRTGLPLATLDEDLRAAAAKLGVALAAG
jgi:predicted nucleic acid-binding protein